MKYEQVVKRHLGMGKKRTGRKMVAQYITVHNTGNPSSTADNERRYLDNVSNTSSTGWHIVVDDKQAIEAIPLDEVAFHAGDGGNGQGNTLSIGIEICESGDYARAERNAIELIASMLVERGWGVDRVKAHKDWSGKQCPRLILPYWNDFKQMIANEVEKQKRGEVMREAKQWELDLIKKVCEAKGMDAALWQSKAMDQVTVADLFMILAKM